MWYLKTVSKNYNILLHKVFKLVVGEDGYIRDWVEKKVRRHLMKARKLRGFGWERWSRSMLYRIFGLYDDYKIRYYQPLKAAHN